MAPLHVLRYKLRVCFFQHKYSNFLDPNCSGGHLVDTFKLSFSAFSAKELEALSLCVAARFFMDRKVDHTELFRCRRARGGFSLFTLQRLQVLPPTVEASLSPFSSFCSYSIFKPHSGTPSRSASLLISSPRRANLCTLCCLAADFQSKDPCYESDLTRPSPLFL
jgi:hypothetical protein